MKPNMSPAYLIIGQIRQKIACTDVGNELDRLPIPCPHCHGHDSTPYTEIIQLGFFEDRALLISRCTDCDTFFGVRYAIEVTPDFDATFDKRD